jgi:hypothetical protein
MGPIRDENPGHVQNHWQQSKFVTNKMGQAKISPLCKLDSGHVQNQIGKHLLLARWPWKMCKMLQISNV